MAAPLMASLYDRKALDNASAIRDKILGMARLKDQRHGGIAWTVTGPQLGLMNGLLGKCFVATESDVARHQFLEFVFGRSSSKTLSMGEASALIDWLKDADGPGPHPAGVADAWVVVKAWGEEHGQTEMEL